MQMCLPHAEALLTHSAWVDSPTKIAFRITLGLLMSSRVFSRARTRCMKLPWQALKARLGQTIL